MKKQYLASIAASVLCAGAAVAQQQTYYYLPEGAGPYVRGEIGPSFFQDGRLTQFGGPANSSVRFNTGLAADAAIGYAFNQIVSMDFETGFIGARINSVSGHTSNDSTLSNMPLLVNAVFSVPIPRSLVTPYFGFGAGGAVSEFDTDRFSDGTTTVFGHETDTVFAWQAFAGLRFMLNRDMSLGVGYKYFTTENPTFSYPPGPNFDVGFQGVRTHTVEAAFQWNF